ncbi:hypothetical protein CGLAUT_04565 [Corynebacterium glaucum]|uniref:nuclear transport factor 2 family protein n=1 Tax=Corynebacterium glaucum TaxID=187491 RepID=UPI0025B30A87|nr:nuclear transport factor 2 family protein [Corynebacterium glaucum]WJZ07411.1 hypothetical protein CGLAUT_04565 [Corynebacterium glaucum]
MADLSLGALLELERSGWDALCESRGGAFYGELMLDDGLMILVNGFVLTRDAVVESLNGASAWASYELSDARVVPMGEDAAALVYRAEARREGEAPFEAIMTSVYHLVDGMARLAVYQQTTATH